MKHITRFSAPFILIQLLLALLVAGSNLWPQHILRPSQIQPEIGVAAHQAHSNLQPQQTARLCQVYSIAGNQIGTASGQPTISGNGKVVAFWSTVNLKDKNLDQNVELFKALLEDNGQISLDQITESEGTVLGGFNLAPSLDITGTSMVFFSDRNLVGNNENEDENFEIFIRKDAEIKQLTHTGEGISNINPVISGNGNAIAFVSNMNGGDEIFVASLDSGLWSFTQVTHSDSNTSNDFPSISDDGNRLVYVETKREESGSTLGNTSTIKLAYMAGNWRTATISSDENSINNQARINGWSVVYISSTLQITTVVSRLIHIELGDARNDDLTVKSSIQINNDDTSPNPSQPAISSDGNRVVFVSQKDTVEGTIVSLVLVDKANQQQYTRQLLGSQAQSALNYGSTNANPVISGNGLAMAWVQEGQVQAFNCPLVVRKFGPNRIVLAGETGVPFTVTVTNLGDSPITQALILSDTVDEYLTIKSATDGGTIVTKTVSWTVNSIAAYGTVTRVFTTTVAADTPQGEKPLSVSTLSQDSTLILTSNKVSLSVIISNNLTISKSGPPNEVAEEEPFNYVITAMNRGPSKAYGVVVSDTLPDKVNISENPNLQTECVQNNENKIITCTKNEMGVNEQWVITIPVRSEKQSSGDAVNTAQIASTHHFTPEASNYVTTTIKKPSIEIIQQVESVSPVAAGTEFKFIITVKNTGGVNANGLSVQSNLQALRNNVALTLNNVVEYSVVDSNNKSIDKSTNGFEFTNNLAINSSWRFTLTVTVKDPPINSELSSQIKNTVSIPDTKFNVTNNNNPASVDIKIPVTGVAIHYMVSASGLFALCPENGRTVPNNTEVTFKANISPPDANPTVYAWTATDLLNQSQNPAKFKWTKPGDKTVTVAVNGLNTVSCKVTVEQ